MNILNRRLDIFYREAGKKFIKGQKEHRKKWEKVNFVKELRGECYDWYWYGDGIHRVLKRKVLGRFIKALAILVWFLIR